jgi:hypothetical protein
MVPAPVNIDWLFRPNDFLIESLRDHSVLSIVWVLSALSEQSGHSFVFVGPTSFGFTPESEAADAEADLLVLRDGQGTLCEVKSSWHSLRDSDIGNFVDLATRLRPDIAVLAVMEAGPGPTDRLADARARLAVQEIAFELITMAQYQPADEPYLPS